MASLTTAAVRELIHSGRLDPVYLLLGEDDVEKAALAGEFGEAVEEGLRAFNVEQIHAGDLSTGDRLAAGVSKIVAAARTLPMMAPRRIVVVAQAEALFVPKRESEAAVRALEELERLLQSPEPLTTLVFVASALDKRSRLYKQLIKTACLVRCGAPEDLGSAVRWVQALAAAAGVRIDPAGARLMASLAGFPLYPRSDGRTGDVKRLRGEVERLLLYALGQRTISLDDVRQLVGPEALQDDWAMTNAIEAGQPAEALRQLALVLDAGAPPERVLGQLAWVVRSKFPQLAASNLPAAIDALFRTDLDLKRSAGDARVLLTRLIVELSVRRKGASGAAPCSAPRRSGG